LKREKNYNRHMKIHNNQVAGSMEPLRGRSKINVTVTPDLDDPNNYCKSCKVYFEHKQVYRNHLGNLHNRRRPRSSSPDITRIVRDIDPPYRHCPSCDIPYTAISNYAEHLINAHGRIYNKRG
jgi:uncharacterized C2H2 Zn-finger protein